MSDDNRGSRLVFAVFVTHARRRGLSWEAIGHELGMRAEAVQRRFDAAVKYYGPGPA